ncbi:MAG: DUF488 domain-containing protein [Nanoarchaeota archaeon]|nr:DUF488 domain-containing protein [Nanoarchaeota archaeon]MBU1005093.1 DUF488 domain-containing protein [Nanoarchaeota archaeon]MBU1946435.1 DUF488 domain-containing protein [Nanoarchaeota archaeon]
MIIYTIGFTKKSLEEFISLLKENNIQKIIDIRLNNSSQLAGFAKGNDLKYILGLVGIEYEHIQELAPDESIFKEYREDKDWDLYEKRFLELMKQRKGAEIISGLLKDGKTACLLCSEDTSDKCHRRLVAELLKDAEIVHLQ